MRSVKAFILILAGKVFLYQSPIVWAADITHNADNTISTATTGDRHIVGQPNVTLTINANTSGINNNGIKLEDRSGVNIIVGSGVTVSVINNQAIDATGTTNATITNSGTIIGNAKIIELENSAANNTTGAIINNNSGGIISGNTNTIKLHDTTSNTTIHNSGEITVTSTGQAIGPGANTDENTVINNNSGGLIRKTSTGDDSEVIELGNSGTLDNSGRILNEVNPNNTAINLAGNNNTIILRNKGVLVGKIVSQGTGNKLQVAHGFGKAYFYETDGALALEDLNGNVIVKGSAGSVGLGAQETIDELLGMRAKNLRATIRRYVENEKVTKAKSGWMETFAHKSKRDGTASLLEFTTRAWGANAIQPITRDIKLLLSLEINNLSLQGDHDVNKKGFLIGIIFPENAVPNGRKFTTRGFVLGGIGWNQSNRQILTNTTSSGTLKLTSNYKSYELIAGGNMGYKFDLGENVPNFGSPINSLHTELGFTLSGSHIEDYNEDKLFFWEDRSLIQESVYLREQFSHKLDEKGVIKFGADFEHRKVLSGKDQEYRIKGTRVNFSGGRNSEFSISGSIGLNYKLPYGLLHAEFQRRIAEGRRETLGGGIGFKLEF